MGKIISYEEALNLPRVLYDSNKVDSLPIYKEADENGQCELFLDTNSNPPTVDILVKVNDDSLKKDEIGYMISICSDTIDIWIAYEYKEGYISSSTNICSGLPLDTSLNECINMAKIALSTCPVCGKSVPYKEQFGYSFAGRCCEECLPEMKKKHEYPGWYN